MSKLKYTERRHSYSPSSSSSDEYDSDHDVEEDENDIILCICDDTSDDGFTIQCEKCDTWQHASCVGIKKKSVPEHYICPNCRPQDHQIKSTSKRRNSREIVMKKRKRILQTSDEEEEEEDNKYQEIQKSTTKEKLVLDLFKEIRRQWFEYSSNSNKTSSRRMQSIVAMGNSSLLLPSIPKYRLLPIKKSLRTSIFNNKQKTTTKLGIFADIHIPENRYLMEITGELSRKSDYKQNSSNNYINLSTPLNHLFFYPYLDVCVDSRKKGNDARFIRRSCCPNAELKSIIIKNDDQLIHLAIYTNQHVDKGEEITLGWKWQKYQLMAKVNEEFLNKNDQEAQVWDKATKKSIQQILQQLVNEFGPCACEDEEDCLFVYLKEQLERVQEEEQEVVVSKKKRSITKKKKENSSKPIKVYLPPKKKWLRLYYIQQQQLREQQLLIKEEEDVNSSSDGGSSQSTIPLNDDNMEKQVIVKKVVSVEEYIKQRGNLLTS